RGIHVDGLDLVVNLDPPADHKDYLHRGGRTARAGESGTVVTLVLPNQRREMARMMATAAITPVTTRVGAGDEELARITGARVPTGIPTVIADPVVERPRRSASASRGRRGRPTRAGRNAQSTAGSRNAAPRRVALAA
ncbi:helicase-related protein, partial [Kitasatospora sp. NPDC054795]